MRVVTKEAYFFMSMLVVTCGNMVFGIVYCIDSRGVDGVGNSGLYYRVDFSRSSCIPTRGMLLVRIFLGVVLTGVWHLQIVSNDAGIP